MNDILKTAYEKAIETLRYNVTTKGFLAARGCYDSYWARDGAITILAALKTGDAKLRRTSLAHLKTLLMHQRADGLIPNHIDVRDGRVFYGGDIGRISAIDANPWYVIGAIEYFTVTRDRRFLASFADSIRSALAYTAHLDSNNDLLIEVPESSDWADLFPRSGNVLTVDVLNFAALQRAGEALHDRKLLQRARATRQAIRRYYFLGHKEAIPHPNTFLFGDSIAPMFQRSTFLTANLTAFGFSWRTDVWGNILAALSGVLTKEEARKLFRYLWSVGISDPYPVRVLYPPVWPGDKEWRDYMASNHTNLPHHYHNGGIWPYAGGFWVVLLHRIGEHKRAQEEKEKLAEANRQGVDGEWEFNEWLHGETGRPMGAKHQAWSAAGYILAYTANRRATPPGVE